MCARVSEWMSAARRSASVQDWAVTPPPPLTPPSSLQWLMRRMELIVASLATPAWNLEFCYVGLTDVTVASCYKQCSGLYNCDCAWLSVKIPSVWDQKLLLRRLANIRGGWFQWNQQHPGQYYQTSAIEVKVTWRRSRPVLLSLGTTFTREVVAGYIGYGYRMREECFSDRLDSERRFHWRWLFTL